MQPPHPRPSARRWLRHLGSAATAVALIAAVLTPVALGAGPADAHTQRVQRCSFDPFAGQQCWYEDVAHTHTPPPTSTPPGQGHPGGTDNEQDDLPDPPDTTPPGEGHPGGTDNEQDDLPDPPDTTPPGEGHPGGTDNEQQDLPTRPGDGQSSDPNNQENGDDQAADTECLSGTFISGDCRPRPIGSSSGAGADNQSTQQDGSLPADIAEDISADTGIDAHSITVQGVCDAIEQQRLRARAVSNVPGLKIVVIGERTVGFICEAGSEIWSWIMEDDPLDPDVFEGFIADLTVGAVCGKIAAGAVTATSVTVVGAVALGGGVFWLCWDAGQRIVYVLEDPTPQRLCELVLDPPAIVELSLLSLSRSLGQLLDIPWSRACSILTTLVPDELREIEVNYLLRNPHQEEPPSGSSDQAIPTEASTQASSQSESSSATPEPAAPETETTPVGPIQETPAVCARVDDNQLQVNWSAVSAESMTRLRRWIVSWIAGYTRIGPDIHVDPNERSFTVTAPQKFTEGRYVGQVWRVDVIASANVGGFEPWTSQRVTPGDGWVGSSGVGEC